MERVANTVLLVLFLPAYQQAAAPQYCGDPVRPSRRCVMSLEQVTIPELCGRGQIFGFGTGDRTSPATGPKAKRPPDANSTTYYLLPSSYCAGNPPLRGELARMASHDPEIDPIAQHIDEWNARFSQSCGTCGTIEAPNTR